jgi:nicotine blue oxidoreductase
VRDEVVVCAWHPDRVNVHGLLLAAGAGRRYGGPKALVDGWLVEALTVLAEGGCSGRTVVLGAEAARARALVPDGVGVVVAKDWAEGMGASLRAGLAQLPDTDAVLVHLVDLPDITADIVRRVLAAGTDRESLARATFAGVPGHPVLIGSQHWRELIDTVAGDTGARDYLAGHEVTLVECGDLATGRDVDRRG